MLVAGVRAHPQSSTGGAITGFVYDPAGAPLAGVEVTASNAATTALRQARTDARGGFVLEELAPGDWRIALREHNGLPVVYEVPVAVGQVADIGMVGLDPLLPSLMETVEVSASSLLETQPGAGAVIRQEEIDNLPVNQRRWENFTLLTPTAVLDPETGEVSFHAAPSTQNTQALNGADDTEEFSPGDNTGSRLDAVVSQAAVREFHTLTAGYDALHGRAAGAEVDTVTRSGTESLHGEALYLARDSDWSNTQPDTALLLPAPDGTLLPQTALPRDWRQQGSASLGGPLLRNRAFWHGVYDRDHRSFPAVATVTDAPQLFFSQALPGDLSGYQPQGADCQPELYAGPGSTTARGTGTESSAALYGTQGACYLNLFDSTEFPSYAQAAAAYDNGLAYLYSLTGETPRQRNTTLATPQIDWQPGRSRISAAYHLVRSSSLGGAEPQPFVARSVTSLGNDSLQEDRGSAQVDTPFLTLLNTARAGYLRSLDAQSSQPPLPQEPLTARNGTASPGVVIGRQFTLGTPAGLDRARYPAETRAQFYDAVTWTHGLLTMQSGGELQHVQDDVEQLYASAGQFSYGNVQDFLIDFASGAAPAQRCGVSGTAQRTCFSHFEQGFGAPGLVFTTGQWAAFVQAQLRLTSRVDVFAGLRAERETLPVAAFAMGSGSLPGSRLGPRLGTAMRITPATVLRAGAGLYYGRAPVTAVFHALASSSNAQQFYTLNSGENTLRFPNVLAAAPDAADAAPDVTMFPRNFKTPEIVLLSSELEHGLGASTSVTLGGVAALGRELPIVVDTNLNPPTSSATYAFSGGPLDGMQWTVPVYTGARPQPQYGAMHTVESRGGSRYAAVTAQVARRASEGLTLRAAYTFSHAEDDGQRSQVSGLSTQVLSPSNFGLQRGTASLDRRQRLAAAAVYEPHFAAHGAVSRLLENGWLAAPVLQLASGQPYSARLSGDLPGSSPEDRTSYGYLGAGGDDFLPLLGRNHYREPYTAVLDLRLSRKFGLSRGTSLELLGECFNLLNRTNLSGYAGRSAVDDDAYQVGSGQVPGQPVSAVYRPTFGERVEQDASALFTRRQIQAGARLRF